MPQYPIIYKKTSNGKHVQYWSQELHPDLDGRYRSVTCKIGGKEVLSAWKQAEPTNVGRSNHRDALAQAEFEIAANYKDKLDVEYHEKLCDVTLGAKGFKPMLAKNYDDEEDNVDHTHLWTQPKLDGMRCIATKDGLMSRDNNPIPGVPHILEALKPIFAIYPDIRLDGELYNHAYKDDFNSIMSAARKAAGGDPVILQKARDIIQYHIYDVPVPNENFGSRWMFLNRVLSSLPNSVTVPTIQIVPTFFCDSEEALDMMYNKFLGDGYEGQMIRIDAPYENKRTKVLLKRKVMKTEEFELSNILPGVGNWAGKAKSAELLLPDGRVFGAGVSGKEDYLAQVYKEKDDYIGTMCTVQFQNYTPDGIPRFGVVVQFDRWG